MVDFHPGYSIGAVTVPLNSLNQQLKTIAKQLGSLADLQGALAAQISELSQQQGNLVETLRQLEEMTATPELPADVFEVIASHLAGDNALRSLANLNVASRMVHEATNSTLYETLTWDHSDRSWWKRFNLGAVEGEKQPRRWKYVKYMLLYAYHDLALKEDLESAVVSRSEDNIITRMFPNIRALLLVPPLQPHRWALHIYQSIDASTLFGSILGSTPNKSRPACMTEDYDLMPDPHPVQPICPTAFDRLDVVLQRGARIEADATTTTPWWRQYQVNKLRIEVAVGPSTNSSQQQQQAALDASTLAQLYKLVHTTAQRASEKSMSGHMMDFMVELPSVNVITERIDDCTGFPEMIRQLSIDFPHLASLNTSVTTHAPFTALALEQLLDALSLSYTAVKPRYLPSRCFIDISHTGENKNAARGEHQYLSGHLSGMDGFGETQGTSWVIRTSSSAGMDGAVGALRNRRVYF